MGMSSIERSRRLLITALVIFLGIAGAVLLGNTDLREDPRWLPRCALHTWTGLHCPGCGNTRAASALLRGDIRGALEQNVFWVVALPFLLAGALRSWIRWVFPERWKPLPFQWKWSYSLTLIGVLLIFTVLRNLPGEPWNWLAPIPLEETTAAASEEPSPAGPRPILR